MVITSKIPLYIAIIAVFSISSANCEETPSIKDIAKVTLENEPSVNVYSIYYCDSTQDQYYYFYNNLEYVIGHSKFKIPFENIHRLEIYKEKNKYYINITDINMNTIEQRALNQYSFLRGTASDNGIKSEFSADIRDYSRIVIVGINETINSEGKEEIIHIIPSSPLKKAKEPECDEVKGCIREAAFAPKLLLLLTTDNPLALNEKISTDNIESAKELLYQGNDYYNSSLYDESLNCYQKAIALVNNSPALWYYKGDALYQLRKYADAVLAYKKATDLAPNFLEAWNNLAVSYAKLGLNDEAKAALAEMQKLKSNNNA